MKNNSGMPEYDTLCETVTETVTSVIRFLPGYLLVESTRNPVMIDVDITDLQNIRAFAAEYEYGEILYGDLVMNSAEKPEFRLQIYDRAEDLVIVRETAEAESLLDVFDTADTMTLDLLGQITDVSIGFGSIHVEKTGGNGSYSVFFNGKRIRNPQKELQKVLNGSYLVEIMQDRILGNTVIYSNTIYVNEFQTTVVSFEIPKATDDERFYLETKKEELLASADDPENIDEFLERIAEFQEITKNIDYDPSLEDDKEAVLEEAGEKAAEMLQTVMEEADGKYYARRPNFEEAYETYSNISGLVNSTFEYTEARVPDKPLERPEDLAVSGEGIFYLLDEGGEEAFRLTSFTSEGEQIAGTSLSALPALTVDSASNCFLYFPESRSIVRYQPDLRGSVELMIPDFEPGPEECYTLAISNDDILYLIGRTSAAVFEYSIGNETYIERDAVIEETLSSSLERLTGTGCFQAFFDSRNNLHLFDPSAGSAAIIDPLGAFIREIQFSEYSPESRLTVDTLGYYFMTLPGEHEVVKFDPDGVLITRFGEYGIRQGQFAGPTGIGSDEESDLYIADTLNNRIQILSLTSPPILLPEIAGFGIKFEKREKSTVEAVEQVRKSGGRNKFFATAWRFTWPLLVTTGGFAFNSLDPALRLWSYQAYVEYESAADANTAADSRVRSSLFHYLSRASQIAGVSTAGLGGYFLGSAITTTIDGPVKQRETIRMIQALDIDTDYAVDEERYRSLKKSYTLGVLTGLLPPIIGAAAGTIMYLIPAIPPPVTAAVTSAFIAVPPIFSHLYGGRISRGALVTGILADLFALTGLFFSRSESAAVRYAGRSPEDMASMNYWELYEENFSAYFLAVALGLRLFAGVYDMREGWVVTNEYNMYEAVEPAEPKVEIGIAPFFDRHLNPGVAVRLLF